MNHFTLSSNTAIQFNSAIDEPISNAIAMLKRDMEKVLEASQSQANRIFLAPLEPSLPQESWTLEISPDEIIVRGADSLGCVYALLHISEHVLGVTPFWFWNDQQFQSCHEKKMLVGIIHSPKYAIRYRGWFVNDEVLIDNWPSGQGEDHWHMVFEALLRCGGNITIPGTDENSLKNRMLAASMGLRITHHHAEPLGAEMFLRAYPNEAPSYITNSHLFERLWEQAVIDQKGYNVIWNLGFRGQGDRPFWDDDPQFESSLQRGKLISSIITRQLEIIKRHVQSPVCCVNLYGEIAELYLDDHLNIPSDIIKIWADNGYGRMVSRRQGNHNPRIHALPTIGNNNGSHGIYYHCSFHDLQASNHLTMSPNAMEFLKAELVKAIATGAGECWIVNSGSIKPHIHSLDFLRNMWQTGQVNIDEWREFYVKTYYGEKNKGEITALLSDYASCTAKYGPHEDDRAGEQIWHHPARKLLCQWMSGDTENTLESLVWLSGEVPFAEQVRVLQKISEETLPKWATFCKKCETVHCALSEKGKRLFDDSILLQGYLHLHGAAGTKAFCESFFAFVSGNIVSAFNFANQSYLCYAKSVKVLLEAEHGKWAGYYSGDCLTDVRLTVSCLDALVSYLRVLGDGPSFHKWEREFLIPAAERNVMLLSSKQKAMTNDELAHKLLHL